MGHLYKHNYQKMAERLGQYVPGAYVSETLVKILMQLVSEEEAKLCSLMPLRIATAAKMAKVWKMSAEQAKDILESLCDKGMVFSFTRESITSYGLAPPVLGFVEFSLMRTDEKLDSQQLSELYYRYCQVEGDFIRQQGLAHPALTRVFPGEDMLDFVTSEVLSFDRVSVGIENATCITTGLCYCRNKMGHMGLACDAPRKVCLTFNSVAKYLAKHGIAQEISKEKAHQIVKECMDRGLVQIGDNTKGGLAVICNCCGCCCDLLLGYRRFGSSGLISPSAFIATIDQKTCTNCGICTERCPAGAIHARGETLTVNTKICLGCCVCARFCPADSCRMETRTPRPYIPEDFIEKIFLAAIDAGKLGNYMFDNQTSQFSTILRNVVNKAVTLTPVKALLLTKPVQSAVLRILRANKQLCLNTDIEN